MTEPTITSRVQTVVGSCLGTVALPPLNARLYEDLEADSLDMVDLTMSLEDAFDITLSINAVDQMVTVGDIVEYIENMEI